MLPFYGDFWLVADQVGPKFGGYYLLRHAVSGYPEGAQGIRTDTRVYCGLRGAPRLERVFAGISTEWRVRRMRSDWCWLHFLSRTRVL